ncbi:TPA: electron transport complex subunit RsxC, partial [Salmonella enterica subsp. enterica serovar 4,[5],12:i:-]
LTARYPATTRVKLQWRQPSPAPKPVSRSSRPEANLPNRPTRVKPRLLRLSPAFRQKKQHSSRLLTRIKWYSESQARLIPITSARHRESCCWY